MGSGLGCVAHEPIPPRPAFVRRRRGDAHRGARPRSRPSQRTRRPVPIASPRPPGTPGTARPATTRGGSSSRSSPARRAVSRRSVISSVGAERQAVKLRPDRRRPGTTRHGGRDHRRAAGRPSGRAGQRRPPPLPRGRSDRRALLGRPVGPRQHRPGSGRSGTPDADIDGRQALAITTGRARDGRGGHRRRRRLQPSRPRGTRLDEPGRERRRQGDQRHRRRRQRLHRRRPRLGLLPRRQHRPRLWTTTSTAPTSPGRSPPRSMGSGSSASRRASR